MADWSADNKGVLKENGHSPTYENIVNTNGFREYDAVHRENSMTSSLSSRSDTSARILLEGGNILTEESRTEQQTARKSIINSLKADIAKMPTVPPRKSANGTTQPPIIPPSITLSAAESIPEETITIPNDGCLYGFTADQMSTFFKYLKVHDRFISYMHKKGITGKKFSTLKDSELNHLGINNPIVHHFREKSKRKKASFIL